MAHKQAILVRTDLKLGVGKIASQVAHASLASYLKVGYLVRRLWLLEGMKKIVLKVPDLDTLLDFKKICKVKGIPSQLIADAGRTQIKAGTITCLGIGPAKEELIDELTRDLKLL